MDSPAYHFSVDDVLECLLAVSERATGLFENDFFGFLKQLHDRFGAAVDLYLFRRQPAGDCRSLADVSDRLRPWFQECPWIRFAPHALDTNTPPYSQSPADQQAFCESIYHEIARFAGTGRTSHWVRLHYFSESYELASYFRSRQVEAILTTDKPAVSYRLPRCEREALRRQGSTEFSGIRFVRSHIRVENLVGRDLDDEQLGSELEKLCPNNGCAVVFTHEYELVRPEVRAMTVRIFSWLRQRQLSAARTSPQSPLAFPMR